MKQSDVENYLKMQYFELENEIPNWNWFKNLKVGDDAILWLDDCAFFRDDINDWGYTLVKVISANEDGSVEIDRNLGKFYYCRLPNESDALIGLIPPTEEHIKRLNEQEETKKIIEKLDNMKYGWDSLGVEKLKRIMKIIEDEEIKKFE